MPATVKQLERLKDPISLKWRVKGLFPDSENPAQMLIVGYIDARQVYDRLDDAVGPENWQEDYFECKGKQFCKIGINVDGEWIWKGDSGIETFVDPSKGETSDSVKRAAVHWGVNREGYELGEISIACKMIDGIPVPCDEAGNVLKGDQILTECKRISSAKASELIFDRNVLSKKLVYATTPEKKTRRKKTEPKIIMP